MFVTSSIRSSWGIIDIASLRDFAIEDGVIDNIEYFRLPNSFQLLSYNDGSMNWIVPKHFLVKRYSDMVEIGTHSSRKLRSTSDSSIIIIDEDLNFKNALPQIGLSIPRYTPGHNGNTQGQVVSIPFCDAKESLYLWKDVLELNHDLGWLIANYIGDGWTSHRNRNNQVILAQSNPDIVGEVKRIIMSYLLEGEVTFFIQKYPHFFKGKPSYSEKLIFSSRSWASFIGSNIGHGAANKHLPEFWQVGDVEFRWGLMAGLIDSDGHVGINRTSLKPSHQVVVKYDTISKTLAQEVVELGHSLGLVGSISYVKTPQGNDAYVVIFNKDSISIMSQKLRLKTRKYIDILSGFKMGTKRNCHIYSPIIIMERLKQLRKIVGITDLHSDKYKSRNCSSKEIEIIKKRNRHYDSISRVISGRAGCRGAIIRETAMEIVKLDFDIFKEDDYWIGWKKMVLDTNFSYEFITSVSPLQGKKPTYGFDIPESHSIVTGSGFLI